MQAHKMEFVQRFADRVFMVDPQEGAPTKKKMMTNGTSFQARRNAESRRKQKQAQEAPLWKPKTLDDMAAVDKHENDAIHQERLFAAIGVLGFIAFLTFKDIPQ